MTEQAGGNLWETPEHALAYLRRVDTIPHRSDGEDVLIEFIPANVRRVLDLGTGSGRLLACVKAARPDAQFVGLDFSQTMLAEVRKRFASDPNVKIVEHNFEQPVPPMGSFDAVISSFAIHHLVHPRKRALYAEIYAVLNPAGVFYNLDLVSSSTEKLHADFLKATHRDKEDPENKLLELQTQLQWLREIGFTDVDCHWKWREHTLFGGVKPAAR